VERAKALHAERHPHRPARISMRPCDHVTSATALAKAAGLQPVRHWFDMERDLRGDAPDPRALAAPLRLAAYTADRGDKVRRAHNTAFRDHYGSTERDPAIWKQWVTGSRNFRAELSFLVLDESAHDAVAGYLLGYFYDADAAADGYREAWIGQLGILPGWRGRGVGTALLAHALEAYRAAGYEQAGLDVDSGNATGALGIYQRVGFEVVRSATSWVRAIPARPAG
jgi:ribosomal protein S18 acetylase RimI-like enzyme